MLRLLFLRYAAFPVAICSSLAVTFHYSLILANAVDRVVTSQFSAALDSSVGRVAQAWGFERPTQQVEENFDPEEYMCLAAVINGLSCDLLKAVRDVESSNSPWAHSNKGAMGYLQLMPATAKSCGMKDPSEAFIPKKNIDCGAWRLAQGIKEENGSVFRGLQNYYGGHGNVVKQFPGLEAYATAVLNRLGKQS